MHVRVVSPKERTDDLLTVLESHEYIVNLVVMRGAAVRPVGDVVLIDVPNEAANSVIAVLRVRGADRYGSVTIERSGTTLSESGRIAADEAPGTSSEAVVWSEVVARAHDDSELTTSFVVMLTLAMAIAAVGLLTDSSILIIGAMVIGPEYGPLTALGFGLFRRNRATVWRSAATLGAGLVVGVVVTIMFALAVRLIGATPNAYEAGVRPLTQFISRPDGWSVVVAGLAGVAGTMSLTQARPSALVGVFISVTTIPAAANIGVASAHGRGSEAWGAVLQLALNMAVIVVAAAATLVVEQEVGRRLSRVRRRPLP